MDLTTALEAIKRFRDERNWAQFHHPKELANAISIEASELMEIFLWKDKEESKLLEQQKRQEVVDEVADIATYLLLLCDRMEIDLDQAILEKVEKNGRKYPVDKSQGISDKYTEL